MRNVDNPSEMTIMFKIDDVRNAREFLDSKHIREVILSAGITCVPDFVFLKQETLN